MHELGKGINFCFINYSKSFECVEHLEHAKGIGTSIYTMLYTVQFSSVQFI